MGAIPGQPEPSPQDSPAPVPGQDEARAAQEFMLAQAQSMKPAPGMDVAAAARNFMAKQNPPTSSLPDMGGQVLDTAGRAMDYAGGGIRTAVAGAVGSIGEQTGLGTTNPVTKEDVTNALKGRAPKSAEYLQRMGIPELGNVDVPLIGRVTGRGVAGFVSDMVTDPIPVLGKLAKEFPIVRSLIEAPNAVSEQIGRSIYKSALTKVDQKVAAKAGIEAAGTTPTADALLDGVKMPQGVVLGEGGRAQDAQYVAGAKPMPPIGGGAPVGSTGALAERVNNISDTIGAVRSGLYDQANRAGVAVDMAQGPYTRAEAEIARIRNNPATEPMAAALQDILDRFKAKPPTPIAHVSSWKSSLYSMVPDAQWAASPEGRTVSNNFKIALAGDLSERIVAAGNKAAPGMGDAIVQINDRWGPLLDARKPLAKAAVQTGVPAGDTVDKAVLTFGGLKKLALKKGLDLATSSSGRTVLGKMVMKAGQTGAANRAFIDTFKQEPNEGQ